MQLLCHHRPISSFFPLVLGCFPWASHQHAFWLMKGDCGRSNAGIDNSYITTVNTVTVMPCHCDVHCVSIHSPVACVQPVSDKDVNMLCVLHSFSVAWREWDQWGPAAEQCLVAATLTRDLVCGTLATAVAASPLSPFDHIEHGFPTQMHVHLQ